MSHKEFLNYSLFKGFFDYELGFDDLKIKYLMYFLNLHWWRFGNCESYVDKSQGIYYHTVQVPNFNLLDSLYYLWR